MSLSVRLANGQTMSLCLQSNIKDQMRKGESQTQYCDIFNSSSGLSHHSCELSSTRIWTSIRTLLQYPVEWTLLVPDLEMSLRISAITDDQEIESLTSFPGSYCGSVFISGTIAGRAIRRSVGFVQSRAQDEGVLSMAHFFQRIGEEVRAEANHLLPANLSQDQALKLFTPATETSISSLKFVAGIESQAISDSLLAPLLEVLNRGGKCWRSFAAMTVVGALKKNPNEKRYWLALPELVHTGSLIIDDIEDESENRRGAPSAHHIYGLPMALNAGSAAYFLAEVFLRDENDKVRSILLFAAISNFVYFRISWYQQCACISKRSALDMQARHWTLRVSITSWKTQSRMSMAKAPSV